MKIEVPGSTAHIYLEGFQELDKYEKPDKVQTISSLLGYDTAFIRTWKSRSVDQVYNIISELFSRKHGLVRRFKLGNVEFGFIPNLDDASYGEVDDIRNTISKIETWHKAMAVLYRPVVQSKGEKYMIEKYEPGK